MRTGKPRFPRVLGAAALLFLAVSLSAQDGFGFGFGDGTEEAGAGGPAAGGGGSPVLGGIASFITGATVHGKAQAKFQVYGQEFESEDRFKNIKLGDLFRGRIDFKASASNAEALISLNLIPNQEEPVKSLGIHEAYLKAFFGPLNIQGGFCKLTWGKADSLGPLDVINPLDYSDLSAMTDLEEIKIARPLLHASLKLGAFTQVEAVFVPWFEGHHFSQRKTDRWTPRLYRELPDRLGGHIIGMVPPDMQEQVAGLMAERMDSHEPSLPATTALEYAQGGARFTATTGPVDWGVQYYSGFLPRPAVALNQAGLEAAQQAAAAGLGAGKDLATVMAGIPLDSLYTIQYNRFHHIGADYAQVVLGFNLRGELGANITGDRDGGDGLVYNPSLVWSAGFDRTMPWGITVNLQINESIRLRYNRIGADSLFDTEAETHPTTTQLTFRTDKKLFGDKLELKATVIWGIEDMDCYVIPALAWTQGDIVLEVSGGVFGGKDRLGELSQYRDNHFVKTLLTYRF
ncbi:MAG: hypothetical protein LBD37_09375 [Treponema sp.]|jgi:hypothetical protein|nr:hypothetical protein [Treponema sp.]